MTMDQDSQSLDQSEAATRVVSPSTEEKLVESSPKAKGRVLASLGFLMGLAALAGAGYLYYELVYTRPMDGLLGRVGSLERALPALTSEVGNLKQAQTENLEILAVEQRDGLAEARQAMITALNDASSQAPPSPREWKLAEVEYLLRIANHRVLMERDVDAAVRLLGAADAILLELDDFALYPVRAGLADEMLALSGVRGNDIQGIYLRLEAAKGMLLDLPQDLPEYLTRPSQPDSGQGLGFWEVLGAELSSYIQLRRFDGARKPLLAPEEAVYLELNLRLMLERAQLAALRRQQSVYEQSITTAQDWLGEFLDSDSLEVQRAVAELDSLLGVQLDQQLPDISGSLAALLKVRRGAG
ncbi:MAG: uroporphyrinogen-III C-methyltransferase [Pseudomonadales bacterium]